MFNGPVRGGSRVTVPQLGTIVFDKQVTDMDGNLTVEAADITLVGGQEVVLGSAMCGGAMPASNSTMHPTH